MSVELVWVFVAVFVILTALGFLIPFVHVLAGIAGIALGIEAFDTFGSVLLSGVIFGTSVLLILYAIVRKERGWWAGVS